MREQPTKLLLGRWWVMAKLRGEGAPPGSLSSGALILDCRQCWRGSLKCEKSESDGGSGCCCRVCAGGESPCWGCAESTCRVWVWVSRKSGEELELAPDLLGQSIKSRDGSRRWRQGAGSSARNNKRHGRAPKVLCDSVDGTSQVGPIHKAAESLGEVMKGAAAWCRDAPSPALLKALGAPCWTV